MTARQGNCLRRSGVGSSCFYSTQENAGEQRPGKKPEGCKEGVGLANDPERAGRSIVKVKAEGGMHGRRSEEHTSELQSLMRSSYAVFCLKQKSIEQTRDTQTTIDMYTIT